MDSLAQEITSIQTFIRNQQQILSGEQLQTVTQQHVQTLCLKIRAVTGATAEQVSDLLTLIQNGPWSQQHRTSLCVAASDALLNATSPNKTLKRPGQNCDSFRGYFTRQDHEVLGSAAQLVVKLDCTLTALLAWFSF